jgi:hypothetical protein
MGMEVVALLDLTGAGVVALASAELAVAAAGALPRAEVGPGCRR